MAADQMRPEELINNYAKARKGVRNITSALGFLALLWSTVVILGGFVSILTIKDFWFVTVLSAAMASNLLTFMESKEGGIYIAEKNILRGMRACEIRKDIVRIRIMTILVTAKQILILCVAILLGYSPHLCLVVSVVRLVQHDYGEVGGDTANKAKLDAALYIFYVLVLIQSVFVQYWVLLSLHKQSRPVSKRCGFGDWGPKLVRKYQRATEENCSKDEPLAEDWNLVAYAVGLLESASLDDRLSGARVLDTFVEQDIVVRQKLLSSRKSIQKLIAMADSTSNVFTKIDCTSTAHNSEIRERAARILAHLAGDIHTAQFPGALHCAFSLLESSTQYVEADLDKKSSKVALDTSKQSSHQGVHMALVIPEQTDNQQVEFTGSKKPLLYVRWIHMIKKSLDLGGDDIHQDSYTFVSKGSRELISQGLLILEGLTQNQDNCTAICNHQRLLSKITSPIMSYQDVHSNTYDKSWIEILTTSLTVLSRLTISPGDGASRLRHEISRNPVAVRNLMGILESVSEGIRDLHEQALEILTEVAFDDTFRKQSFDESSTTGSITEKFIQNLERILFEDEDGRDIAANQDRLKHKRLTRKAGEALARLLAIPSAVGTTEALNSAANGYGNVVDLRLREDMSNMLRKLLHKILSCKTVAEDVASNVSAVEAAAENKPPPQDVESLQHFTEETKEQYEERKLIAAMLSLAVVICTKYVISEEDFARAAPEDAALVQKLKEIIQINQDARPDCLRIVKLSCQAVITISHLKPRCIKDFNEHSLEKVLCEALNTLSDLDNCMLFAGDDRDVTKPVMSLPSLVKEAQRALQRST